MLTELAMDWSRWRSSSLKSPLILLSTSITPRTFPREIRGTHRAEQVTKPIFRSKSALKCLEVWASRTMSASPRAARGAVAGDPLGQPDAEGFEHSRVDGGVGIEGDLAGQFVLL